MTRRKIFHFLCSLTLIGLVTISCTPSKPEGDRNPDATKTIPTAITAPSEPTNSPVPSPTQLLPTKTFTLSPPSLTPTSEPTQEPPTTTPTSVPIPELERTLSLQTPAMQGDDVLALQEQLLRLGYNSVGTPDGIFGGMTENAVEQFQADQGLVADGIVGHQTWEVLFVQDVAHEETPDQEEVVSFYLGISDPEVEVIEERLLELGYPICEIDPIFGTQTTFAVTQFQATNNLAADGVVEPQTWDVLFSEAALPMALGKQLSFSSPMRVGSADNITYDGKNLWIVNNDFGTENDVLQKLDASSGIAISEVRIPPIDEIIGWDGKAYPYHLHPTRLIASKNVIWVAGRANAGTETGAPSIVAVQPNGKLLGDPFYADPMMMEYEINIEFFVANNQIWAVFDEPEATLYQFNDSSYQSERRIPLYDMYKVSSATFDGNSLWLAGYKGNEWGIWSTNINNGVVGGVLGVCGYRLTFDGKWVWVAMDGLATAVDPKTLEVMATATFQGSPVAMTSNGKNQIWLLSVRDAKYSVQSLITK